MSSWLKKSNKFIKLYQTSEIPYPITNEYVLVYNRLLTEDLIKLDNYIGFEIEKKQVKRYSAAFWQPVNGAVKIPIDRICLLSNQTGKQKFSEYDNISVAVLKPPFVKTASAKSIEIVKSQHTKTFLITKNAVSDTKIRETGESVDEHIISGGSWHYALAAILNVVACSKSRDENWMTNIPSLQIDVFGLENVDDLDTIKTAINDLDVGDKVDLCVR